VSLLLDAAATLDRNASTESALQGTWSAQAGTTIMTGLQGNGTTLASGVWISCQPSNATAREWRQVVRVTNDNTLQINRAWTNEVTAATIYKVVAPLLTAPTQQYGVFLDGQVLEVFLGQVGATTGNKVQALAVSSTLKSAPAAADRVASWTTSLANAQATSLVPPVTSGALWISDGVDVSGLVVFQTSTVPVKVTKAAGAATLAVTTGVLTGGLTGSSLTVSAHTDGRLYLENHRGGTRQITLLFLAPWG